MWRLVLSAVFVVTGLIWLFTGVLRGPALPSANAPLSPAAASLQKIRVATSFPATAEPITIALPERSLPDSHCGPVTGNPATPDCALAALLEQDPAAASPQGPPVVAATGDDGGSVPKTAGAPAGQQQNAKRTAGHRLVRRPVAVAKNSAADRPLPSQPSVTWRFPSDPSVGGAG